MDDLLNSVGGRAAVIVIGNIKGGSGKTTTAMHLVTSLMRRKIGDRFLKVGCLDTDVDQLSFQKFLKSRERWAQKTGREIDFPVYRQLKKSTLNEVEKRESAELQSFLAVLESLTKTEGCDVVVIDTPGSNTWYSRLAHSAADTLITPFNCSMLDLDLVAEYDATRPWPESYIGPSRYTQLVWEAWKTRDTLGMTPSKWFFIMNRFNPDTIIEKTDPYFHMFKLAEQLDAKASPGIPEREVFSKLWPYGLTLFDLDLPPEGEPQFRMLREALDDVQSLFDRFGIDPLTTSRPGVLGHGFQPREYWAAG